MKELNFIGIGGATNIPLGGNCCYIKDNDNLLMIDACEEALENDWRKIKAWQPGWRYIIK